jgi:hypothetical protein
MLDAPLLRDVNSKRTQYDAEWLARVARVGAAKVSLRLSVVTVLALLAAAIYFKDNPTARSPGQVPIEILRTKPAPVTPVPPDRPTN